MEMRPQMYLCRVCTRPPLLVKPPKRHEQGPQGPTYNLGEAVPRASLFPDPLPALH